VRLPVVALLVRVPVRARAALSRPSGRWGSSPAPSASLTSLVCAYFEKIQTQCEVVNAYTERVLSDSPSVPPTLSEPAVPPPGSPLSRCALPPHGQDVVSSCIPSAEGLPRRVPTDICSAATCPGFRSDIPRSTAFTASVRQPHRHKLLEARHAHLEQRQHAK
jgi:hypothetical protein